VNISSISWRSLARPSIASSLVATPSGGVSTASASSAAAGAERAISTASAMTWRSSSWFHGLLRKRKTSPSLTAPMMATRSL